MQGRGEKRKKRKKRKRERHRQKVTAREISNDRMKTAGYKLELLTIEPPPLRNKSLRKFVNRNS